MLVAFNMLTHYATFETPYEFLDKRIRTILEKHGGIGFSHLPNPSLMTPVRVEWSLRTSRSSIARLVG